MSYHPEEDLWHLLLRGYTVSLHLEEEGQDMVILLRVTNPSTDRTYRGRDLSVLHEAFRDLT